MINKLFNPEKQEQDFMSVFLLVISVENLKTAKNNTTWQR